jgi:hypothetical protein
MLGASNLKEISQTLSGLVAQLITGLATKLGIFLADAPCS